MFKPTDRTVFKLIGAGNTCYSVSCGPYASKHSPISNWTLRSGEALCSCSPRVLLTGSIVGEGGSLTFELSALETANEPLEKKEDKMEETASSWHKPALEKDVKPCFHVILSHGLQIRYMPTWFFPSMQYLILFLKIWNRHLASLLTST